jgi:hypothetical protein
LEVLEVKRISVRPLVHAGIAAEVLLYLAASAHGQPCSDPMGQSCGNVSKIFDGCRQNGGHVYNGAKATLDDYNPALCQRVNGNDYSFSAWWVMLQKAGTHWVQAGFLKSRNDAPFPWGLVCYFWAENDPGQVPQYRQNYWSAAGSSPVECECFRSITAGNVYVMRVGGHSQYSRDFGGQCFTEAQFYGETHHPNDQMPGDTNDHVRFDSCQTKLSGKPYTTATLRGDDPGANYGLVGPNGGDFEIYDTRCP